MEYEEYTKKVNKYFKDDCREINFQNRIIIPFLESLIQNYDIVDSSTLYKNWKKINRDSFDKQYTPDVLVVENWKLFEEKNSPLIIVEVKRPTANDRSHAENEVNEYMNIADYVILTDCITWEIYKKNEDFKEVSIIKLDDTGTNVCERKIAKEDDRNIKWSNNNEWNKLKEIIVSIVANN